MPNEADVKLFSAWYSPYAQRVLVALREKGIKFENVEVDLANKPKELLEANAIHQKIPTLVHNGKAVAESLVILEYLEDAWPKVPLFPDDAFGKSQCRFWADYVYQLLSKVQPNFRYQPGSPERAAVGDIVANGLKTLEEAMTTFSAEGPFFSGEKFGYVDVVMAPLAILLPVQEAVFGLTVPGPEKLPRYYKWLDAIRAHPSVKDTIPSPEVGIPTYRAFIERRVAEAAAAAAAATPK